jgi:hypothetical protein
VQVNLKLVAAVSAPVLCVPLVNFVPLQPSDAVQLVALVELQVNIDALPLATLVGLAVSVTVGADRIATCAV